MRTVAAMDLTFTGAAGAPRPVALLLRAWLNYGSRRCGQAETWLDTIPAARFDLPAAARANGDLHSTNADAETELRR